MNIHYIVHPSKVQHLIKLVPPDLAGDLTKISEMSWYSTGEQVSLFFKKNFSSLPADCLVWMSLPSWRQLVPLGATLTATSCSCFGASRLTTASSLTSSSPLKPAFWSTSCGTLNTWGPTGRASLQPVEKSVCQIVNFRCRNPFPTRVLVICLH